MRFRYKKLLSAGVLMTVLCALQSCSSEVPDVVTDPGSRQEVEFAAVDLSRAITSTVNYTGSKFSLFGDMKYTSSGLVEVFHGVEVEYNGGLWKYSGTRYWYPGHEHSFVAVHPAEAVKNSVGLSYADSKLSFVYSLPMAADGVTIDKAAAFDLLAATHRRLYDDGVTTAVTLRFSHLMSLLNLAPAFVDNLMGNDDYILIHRLELSGVNTSARFDILPAQRLSNPQTDDKVVDITPSGESNSVIVLPTPVKINNHQGNVSLFADNDAIIIIPQSFAAGSDASIIFHFSINEETTMRQVALPLSNLNWDSGKSYLYKVTFERSGLVLDKCEINSWNDIKGDEITVD